LREWKRAEELRRGVLLDAFVLMPNHLHGIITLNFADDLVGGDEQKSAFAGPSPGIGAIVAGYKAAVSAAAAKQVPSMVGSVWQRGFHDRIIRSEAELRR